MMKAENAISMTLTPARACRLTPGRLQTATGLPSAVMPSAALPPSPDAVLDALRGLAEDDALDASASLRAGALFARLKSLNRTANTAARAHKQVTADARTEMDQTHLGLQNLLYEKRHLEREIEKCRQFA
jgi:THO complex subunit 5